MKPSQLAEALRFFIKNNEPVLIKGKPGIGKTELVADSCVTHNGYAGANLLITYPAVSDPTDAKGLPFADKQGLRAKFLPFGDLAELLEAKGPTVYFMDDLGQSTPAVQASFMNLILGRRINGEKISDHVTFIAATNRREDKAGVSGILEPVKSRFASILELEVNTDDWVIWALSNDVPTELISFIRFRPTLLEDFKPSKDIVNTPSPRTVTAVGRLLRKGVPKSAEFEIFSGTAGEAFAAEFMAFLKIYRDLPSVDSIILNPEKSMVPTEAATRYALSGALGARLNDQNAGAIFKYLKRLPGEIAVATVTDACRRPKETVTNSRAYLEWTSQNTGVII